MQVTKNSARILVIGFGSIGRRHFENLKTLGYKKVFVFDTDKKKVKSQKQKIKSLDKRTLENFDVAFICNPNSKHIETALKCAEAGLHIFIEKSLSYNLNGVTRLKFLCEKNKLINMVACNMRFHPAFQTIRKYIENGKLGRIHSISHKFGHFLPYWRPGTDYRKNYAAKKGMGGGIVLDDVHEFDLLFWLNNFSPVLKSFIIKSNSGVLEIETEDQAKAIFKFKSGVLGSVSCDYLSKKYVRRCFIVGERGNLNWEWNENIVWLENEKGRKKILSTKNYDFNRMYIEEIKYFMESVAKKRETFNNVKTAESVLKYLL
jgi:predicted dehydrogenase